MFSITLESLKNQKILLLGKPRAFEIQEFNYQLKEAKITLVKSYEDSVVSIVEGRLVTPYEQNELDRLYEVGLKEKFMSIDELENLLIKNIDEDALLMGLKLSHDKDRLFAYLKNSQIKDTLFLKLLKLYDWQGEGFFDNDENRDITAALISRFYENIERNHNVQYATLGLMHLVEQSNNSELIEVIAGLEPLKKGFSNQSLYAILLSIAKNRATPDTVLKMFLKNGNLEMKQLIASRKNLSVALQKLVVLHNDETLNEVLCKNENIDLSLVEKFQEKYPDLLAQYVKLEEKLFELFLEKSPLLLALNSSLTCKMQERLLELACAEVAKGLTCNTQLCERVAELLLQLGNDEVNSLLFSNPVLNEEHLRTAFAEQKYHLSLAQNENTPVDVLEKLGTSKEFEVLKALCANVKTPIAVLYELRLDQRLDRIVSENESFGEHIKTENIGWKI
jgi:hypothetical protein